jgi:hypothetical protein
MKPPGGSGQPSSRGAEAEPGGAAESPRQADAVCEPEARRQADAGCEAEARRQRALLDALAAGTMEAALSKAAAAAVAERGARLVGGLQAYRANADALAERALAAAFPTLQALVGAADFARLAREHWRREPPERGDLGAWGERFPAVLERHPAFAAYPYLADCARLDWAAHVCERAADGVLDAGSLALLQSGDPARLRLLPMPGTAVLRSRWPIVTIRAAHAAAEPDLEEARISIAQRRGESAMVVRAGWRAAVHPLDEASAAWMEQLLAGCTLAGALDQAGDGFDFAAWLARALAGGWLLGASEAPAEGTT